MSHVLTKCLGAILITFGILQSEGFAQSLPTVVATTSILCDLTKQIAGNTVEVKCLEKSGIDPHLYQPTPEDRKAIDSGDLILYGGYDFDPALKKLISASSNSAPKIAVFEKAVPKPLRDEQEKTPDPHVWHNAKNGVAMVVVISDSLEKLQPAYSKQYQAQENKLNKQLTEIDNWIKSQIQTIPANQRKLVTTHDALGYYCSSYGLTLEGALQGLSTETAPAARRVGQLVEEIKATQVPTIFAESTVNPKLIQQVAKEANVKVWPQELFADGLSEKGNIADSYQKMLISNTRAVVEGLGGQYKNFEIK